MPRYCYRFAAIFVVAAAIVLAGATIVRARLASTVHKYLPPLLLSPSLMRTPNFFVATVVGEHGNTKHVFN